MRTLPQAPVPAFVRSRLKSCLNLIRRRQEKEVRGCYAINRGHKGDRDAAAHLLDVFQMFHHLDETQHRADDSDRRRVAAGRLVYLGQASPACAPSRCRAPSCCEVPADPSHRRSASAPCEEMDRRCWQIGFQRNDAVLTGLGCISHDLFDRVLGDWACSKKTLPDTWRRETASLAEWSP